ncbi:hypothetical protein AYI68_g6994 [Smittium mucronatum]|uniref:Uncharacterized protein n=1 Tax=Smittium mucronatum TaxID=133383 RepID=A0A1R0GQ17_9FUNG|nr:hypothetical protein AYI68_g6994 [Smittium mucronatum]
MLPLLRNPGIGLALFANKFWSWNRNWSNSPELAIELECTDIELKVLTQLVNTNYTLDDDTIENLISGICRATPINCKSKKFGLLVNGFVKKHSSRLRDDQLERCLVAAEGLQTFFKRSTVNIINKEISFKKTSSNI